MTTVQFYEKPGCINNTRQKELLRAAGHTVVEHSILTHNWTKEKLLPFFGLKPVKDWFNRSAPRVKSGEIVPEKYFMDVAISLLLEDHLLIKRPLMEANGVRVSGFDIDAVDKWIGLTPIAGEEKKADEIKSHDLTKCAKGSDVVPCPTP